KPARGWGSLSLTFSRKRLAAKQVGMAMEWMAVDVVFDCRWRRSVRNKSVQKEAQYEVQISNFSRGRQAAGATGDRPPLVAGGLRSFARRKSAAGEQFH